jgi:hypothetical protein|tara:strand:- start:675 stop:881 length:207 start_codon:yes stop_codon:yes gene_type:complete
MIIFDYKSKEELAAAIGQPLAFTQHTTNSMLGGAAEYRADGELTGADPYGREFFAVVTMSDGLISKVK